MYVRALHTERRKVLAEPLHEQQSPTTSFEPILTHAAMHAPVVVEPRSFKPKVGSMDTTSPTL
jgi:hypothetical protein